MNHGDLKFIFLGTPDFAVPTLKKFLDNNLKPFLVFTQPDKPIGRSGKPVPSPVKIFAQANNLEVVQPRNAKELLRIFKNIKCDVAVLVAYGMIIPKDILNQPKFGFLNLHPSHLPKYRGPSPIQYALLNGDEKTAVTIIKLAEEVDAGPILAQDEININPGETYTQLSRRLAEAGADLMVVSLLNYVAGKTQLKDQNHRLASFTRLIQKEDGRIDWHKPAVEVFRQYQAYSPWPGLFTNFDQKRLKITNLSLIKGQNRAPGEVFLSSTGELAVGCGTGALALNMVQLEGKKEVSGQEFLRGHQDLVGKNLA